MKQTVLITLLTAALSGCAASGGVATSDGAKSTDGRTDNRSGIVGHPDKLQFEDFELTFPDAEAYRHELTNGNVAYIVEDHSLPLVRMTILSPAGAYLLNGDQPGLASMTGTMLRDGGTQDLSAQALDERLDFLATAISTRVGITSSQASLDSLSANLDESLDLLFDVLSEPRLELERLAINKNRIVEELRKRNDDTRAIEPRFWSRVMLGDGFFLNQLSTQASIEAISQTDIRAFAERVFASGNLIIAVSGDVDTADMVSRLNTELARLKPSETLPPIPDTPEAWGPGLYGVDKDEVTQTRVSIGHPGVKHGHPDQFAIRVMNEILGGGGFTSRITSRVRSDEGLAYSAGSSFSFGRHWPGQFRALFQSKNPSVPQAVAIVLEEIERIRTEPVSAEELNTAKQGQVAYLSELYSDANTMARRFATDELRDESPEYWREYEVNTMAVTAEDVLRVAKTHLHPDQLRILVVGKLSEVRAGDGDHGTLEEATGQQLERLPLRDPLTLEVQSRQLQRN